MLGMDRKKLGNVFQSVLIRLFAAFIIIVAVFSVLFFLTQHYYLKTLTQNEISNTYLSFSKSVDTIDRYFNQMKYTFAEVSMDSSMYAVTERKPIQSYEHTQMVETMRTCVFARSQNEFAPYIETLFIVTPLTNQVIIESTGTYLRDSFFSQHYINPLYNDGFWQGEMQKDFVFKTYPVDEYTSVRNAVVSNRMLTPVAYKHPANNNFIMVSLVDICKMLTDIFGENKPDIIIYNNEGEIVYPKTPKFDAGALGFSEQTNSAKAKDGYVLKRATAVNGLVYYGYYPSSGLLYKVENSRVIFLLAYLLTLAIAISLAALFAASFNRPVKQIIDEINNNNLFKEKIGSDLKSLRFIKDSIRFLISQNTDYLSDINKKDSILKSIFLQSRMRDIYVSIDDVESQINISGSFAIIYMRVNYKDTFYSYLQEESGKATFFLKQLIELYLENIDIEATTFQIENDQIVSVLNVEPDFEGIGELVRSIVSKLENESEYAFFTVVASDVHDDISGIKSIYDRMYELSKYAKPAMETQILTEGEIKQGAGRFYFSVEQMEKLSATLQNDTQENGVRIFNEILDYNIKKDVNGFDLYLLCTEIVNCAVKLVNRLFHATPQSLNIASVYAQLDKAVTLEQYRRICEDFLIKVMEYIKANKREEDYIINFILDYVENHYSEDIYLNLFAEKLKLTAAYISSYFKEKMNVNLSDYINSFRIKKAVALIENPQNKNKDIASMVGLQNINTFIRLFKKYTGYTPGEYRKKHFNEM